MALFLFRRYAGHMIVLSSKLQSVLDRKALESCGSHPESGVRKVVTGEKVLATSSLSDRK